MVSAVIRADADGDNSNHRGVKQVVVQSEIAGKLERGQTIFDGGRLVAFHTYRQLASGP
jgi:hypothetical protein